MHNARMETLRHNFNKILGFESSDSNEILNKSRELDKLILLSIKTEKYSKTILGGGSMNEFGAIVDKIQLFDKMYDSMRIVDPVSKKVLEIAGNEVKETDRICHKLWNRESSCENCISARAYNENETFFKIEQNNNIVYMITAVPVNIKNQRIIVEFLKNATSSLCFGTEMQNGDSSIFTIIEYMNRAVVRDELTGLYNRRFINERLPNDLFNSTLKEQSLSLIFADIDYFKSINDTYGHPVGDQVLIEFSALLKKHTRSESDWIARYGGEEFLICLPDTELEKARAIAERIRASVAENEFNTTGGKVHITCSFGVHAVYNENECMTIEGIIDLVDKKLYEAKVKGRNRVE